MGCIESNALAPRHRLLLHRMTWMSRIGGSLAEFNIAAGECFKKIKIWSGLILFVKKPNPADSFIPKNKGMAEERGINSGLAARVRTRTPGVIRRLAKSCGKWKC